LPPGFAPPARNAIVFAAFAELRRARGEADPPWSIARDEAIPAAMNKNELKKTVNRDDASARVEFAIMERVKDHSFLPKTAGNCQAFTRSRAARALYA
jgi:hypothetical protein